MGRVGRRLLPAPVLPRRRWRHTIRPSSSVNDQLNFALLDKIRKSQRNILRKIVLAVVFVVLLMSLAAAFWLKPRFMTRREVRLLLNLGIFYLFAGG